MFFAAYRYEPSGLQNRHPCPSSLACCHAALGFRVRRNSLRNLYADSRAARPAGRAKLRSGAGGREILGSQDHRTVSLPSTAAPAPLRRTVIPRSSLRDPLRFKRRVCYAPKAPAPLREDGHVLGPLSRTQLPPASSGTPGARADRTSHSANQLSLCQTAVWWNSPIDARRRFPMTIAVQRTDPTVVGRLRQFEGKWQTPSLKLQPTNNGGKYRIM